MEEETPEGYSYVLTALRPSIVKKSVAGSFLGVGETNLVTSKSSYIDVFSLEESQLLLQCELPVYLRIRELLNIKTMFPVDLIFMVLDIYFVIAAFDFQSKQLRPLYSEKMLTREESDAPDLVFNIYNPPDPSTKQFIVGFSVDGVFTLSRYEMDLSFSAINGLSGNIASRNYDFTIESGFEILDVVFMDGGTSVTFVTKDSDSRAISVKSYDIDCEHSLLIPGSISGHTNDSSTCVLVPIAIHGGAITIGLKEINYFKPTGKKMITFPPPETEDDEGHPFLIKLCEPIDQNLYLYGDATSRLYLIQIERDKGGEVSKLHRIELGFQGEVTCCTKLAKIQSENSANVAYLVFIGTLKGDAKLMTIIPSNPLEQRVETEAIFNSFYAKNFGLNESDPRSTTIVGCSDQYNYLNILKSGASVTEYASFQQNNVKAVWAVKRKSTDEYHMFLVFSFVGHTRILKAGKDVYETVIDTIKSDVETLHIGNADHDFIVHVVPSGITLLNSSMMIVSQWKVPSGVITAAASTPSQVTVAQGKALYHFKVEESGLVLQATATHPDDIAFIIYEENFKKNVGLNVFVAFWHSNIVQCLALPTLQILSTIKLDEPVDAVIRCLAYRYRNLMIGLGDGRALQYDYDPKTHVMSKRRTFSLGTTQVRCVSVDVGDNDYFFACSDKPSLLITDELGLRPIPVNSSSPIGFVSPFKFEYLEDWAFVAISDIDVRIITVENTQKLHSTKFDMKEYTPNDVDYYPPHDIYSVTTSKEGGAYIHLVDINLPPDHPQNQYSFVIDTNAEPRGTCYARMRNEATGQMIDFIAAVTYVGEFSTLSLYEVKRNSEGIYVLAEYQSVQFENKVVRMRPFQDMLVLCCAESMVLVRLNRQGEIDFPAEGEGLFFHSMGVDPKSGLIVPLSLSTELDLFTIVWRGQDEADFTPLELDSTGFKCRDLPVQVAFLDGAKQHLVAGTLRGQLQYFFGPSKLRQRMFEYNLSDTLTSMRNTKEGLVLYTTIGGAVGLCKQLTKDEYDLFVRIQTRLNDLIPMLVPVSHSELRFNYSNIEDEDYDMQVVKSNIIDGEFVAKYLTLTDDLKDQIAKEVNMTLLELDEKIINFNQQLLFS